MTHKDSEAQSSITEDSTESEQNIQTERSIERDREDERYVPVIIKRSDQFTRHPDDVLEAAILEGEE